VARSWPVGSFSLQLSVRCSSYGPFMVRSLSIPGGFAAPNDRSGKAGTSFPHSQRGFRHFVWGRVLTRIRMPVWIFHQHPVSAGRNLRSYYPIRRSCNTSVKACTGVCRPSSMDWVRWMCFRDGGWLVVSWLGRVHVPSIPRFSRSRRLQSVGSDRNRVAAL
jgi:hypothetical protein